MNTETALPIAPEAPVSGQDAETKALTDANRAIDQDDKAGEIQAETKPEKTPEQREIERLRRGIDRKTRQLAETRAKLGLTQPQQQTNNQPSANDSEQLTLTRAQLREMVKGEATKLAPTLTQKNAEVERRAGIVDSLAKTWGKMPPLNPDSSHVNRFDEMAAELDEALGGLQDQNGVKPAADAIFEADDPKSVIEYLADPDHEEEAEALSKMNGIQAGKTIAKLEIKIKELAAKAKPQASKIPAPLESVKGQTPTNKKLMDLEGDDFDKRRREMVKNRR